MVSLMDSMNKIIQKSIEQIRSIEDEIFIRIINKFDNYCIILYDHHISIGFNNNEIMNDVIERLFNNNKIKFICKVSNKPSIEYLQELDTISEIMEI